MRSLLLLSLLAVSACDTTTDAGGTEIVAYSGTPITRADASVPNPPLSPAEWEAGAFLGRAAFSVFVRRATLCGDECSRTVRLTFTTPHSVEADGLPESVAGVVEVQSYLPESFTTTELAISRVEIQDWGPEVYSGVVYATPQAGVNTAPMVFWAESRGTAVE